MHPRFRAYHAVPLLALFVASAAFSQLARPSDSAIADFNGDGRPDLVRPAGNTGAFGLVGNEDGTFQKPTNYPMTVSPYSTLLLADLNGDGKPDIVAPDADVSLVNNGDGTFHEVTMLPKQ